MVPKLFYVIILTLFFNFDFANAQLTKPKQLESIATLNQEFVHYTKAFNDQKAKTETATKIITICSKLFNVSNPTKSNNSFDIAEQFFLKHKDFEQLGNLLNNKGEVYLNEEYYILALKCFNKSINYYQKSATPCLAYMPTNNLGNIYINNSDYKKADLQARLSLKLLEECKGELDPVEFKNDKVIREMNLGLIYSSSKNYKKAIDVLSKLTHTEHFERDISPRFRIFIYDNLLINKSYLQNTTELNEIKKKVLSIDKNKLDQDLQVMYHETLAYIGALQHNKTDAYINIRKALAVSEGNNISFLLQQNYSAMVFVCHQFNDYKNEIFYQNKLIVLNDDEWEKSSQRNIQELAVTYKVNELENDSKHLAEQGKIDQLSLKLAYFKNRVLIGVIVLCVLAIFFSVLGFYNKNKKAKQFAKQNRIIDLKNKDLEKLSTSLELSNRTIRKTFSIISHDLRNPFQALLAYSSELAENYDHLDRDKMIFYLKIIRRVAEENFNFTQSLLEWSLKQYQGFGLDRNEEDMHDLVEEGIKSLVGFATFQNVKIVNEVAKVKLTIDKKVILTIVNNLLTNAVKFALVNTNVMVKSKQNDESFSVSISNDEKTLTKERLNYIKTYLVAPSADEEDYDIGFGLKIVKEMANLHNAKIEFNSQYDRTEVTLCLKI